MSNEEPRTVLIIAPSNDVHALTVAKRLHALGSRAIVLDSASYPDECRLRHSISDVAVDFELSVNGETITAANLAGVWWRRPQLFRPAYYVRETLVRRFVVDEARHAFGGWLASLGQLVINQVFADA